MMSAPKTKRPSSAQMILSLGDANAMAAATARWLELRVLDPQGKVAKAYEAYAQIAKDSPIQQGKTIELGSIDKEALLKLLKGADRLAQSIDRAIRSGHFSSRCALSDARLDYGAPLEYPYLES